jgi:hypothetical protein
MQAKASDERRLASISSRQVSVSSAPRSEESRERRWSSRRRPKERWLVSTAWSPRCEEEYHDGGDGGGGGGRQQRRRTATVAADGNSGGGQQQRRRALTSSPRNLVRHIALYVVDVPSMERMEIEKDPVASTRKLGHQHYIYIYDPWWSKS